MVDEDKTAPTMGGFRAQRACSAVKLAAYKEQKQRGNIPLIRMTIPPHESPKSPVDMCSHWLSFCELETYRNPARMFDVHT
jgi:hypothetical protein